MHACFGRTQAPNHRLVESRRWCYVVLYGCRHYLLRLGPSLNLELTDLADLLVSVSPGSSCPYLLLLVLQAHIATPGFLTWVQPGMTHLVFLHGYSHAQVIVTTQPVLYPLGHPPISLSLSPLPFPFPLLSHIPHHTLLYPVIY